MSRKKSLILVSIILAVLFSLIAYFVLAAVAIISPVTYGNYSSSMLFNCTKATTDDPQNATNATLFYNSTGGPATLNLTTVVNSSLDDTMFNATVTISSLTNSLKTYNFTCKLDNGTSQITISVANVTIDNTPPNVSYVSVNGNYSGNLLLNASVNDTIMGVTSVYFNLTNTTGQAAFLKALRVTGDYYNYTLNTLAYADGKYNVTVYANDTQLNNLNNSERIVIIIDNTAPTLTYTCTSTTPLLGESITCSCSGSDSGGSGFNTSTLSYEDNPSTGSTGTFTLTCTGQDYAGVTGTTTTSYTVEGSYGAGTGGGGGAATTYWTLTTAASTEQLTQGYTRALSSKQRINVKVNNIDHYVGLIALTTTTATINVSSTPQQATMSIGEEKKFEVTDDNFYDLSVKLNGIANNKANITIKSIHEEKPAAAPGEETGEGAGEEEGAAVTTAAKGLLTNIWFWIIIVIVIIVIITLIILNRK